MDQKSTLSSSLHFSPLLEGPWLWAILVIAAIIFIISLIRYKRALLFRVFLLTAFIIGLLNPSILQQERNYARDVATIIVDQSASQNIEKRNERTKTALEHLKNKIEQMGDFELRIVNAPKDSTLQNKTELFSALDQALVDVPVKRRAGTIFLSDGQIHDIPKDEIILEKYGPVHLLLSGQKAEKDRRIIVTQAPAYGLVGKKVTVKYRVEDTKNIARKNAEVTLNLHDGSQRRFTVPIGTEQSIELPLDHPSQNIFTLSVEGISDEITLANNQVPILINGVRDRLKVLLVSGIPHSGERTWRDLLKSDPGVDLVHFTILRGPRNTLSFVPQNELALIAFPYRELFEIKLYDFDLIIFDRYKIHNILTDRYFNNIVRYVKKGGAVLVTSGPAFAGDRSIYNTPLDEIIPGKPTGQVIEKRFIPSVTNLGHQHPVTKSLIWKNERIEKNKKEHWGSWLRYIDIEPSRGDILMEGPDKAPLLLLDRLEEGRVAQIASDHIWLWSRDYDGGGPHTELLRRIVHWLMKEPELDERAMNVSVNKDTITIEKQGYDKNEETVAMTTPNGNNTTITLKKTADNILRHKFKAQELGIYAFKDTDGMRKFAIIGDLDPPELRDIRTTSETMLPIITASKGTDIWLVDTPRPQIRSAGPSQRYGGSNWLALKRNKDFTVVGTKNIALLPKWLLLLTLMSLAILLWWREGKS